MEQNQPGVDGDNVDVSEISSRYAGYEDDRARLLLEGDDNDEEVFGMNTGVGDYHRDGIDNRGGSGGHRQNGGIASIFSFLYSASTTTITSPFLFRFMHLVLVLVVLIVVIPYMLLRAVRDFENRKTDHAALYSAAVVVLITVMLSTKQIYTHLMHWYMPDVQKYVVRILWMVPLYATQSWLSLRFRHHRIYIDAIRDLYEAYVIQSFVYYLIGLLGGENTLIVTLQNKDDHYGEHDRFSSYFLSKWDMGLEFMLQCKHGVLQYVVAKTAGTLLTLFLEPINMYGEGDFDPRKGYAYISFVINISQMYALYCLIKLFHATAEDLRHPKNWRPMGKFLCVKGVVFFTWWQGLGISILQSRGVIRPTGSWGADDVANGLQDYMICLEMFAFAVAHSFTFRYEEYTPDGVRSSGTNQNGSGLMRGGSFSAVGSGDTGNTDQSGPNGINSQNNENNDDDILNDAEYRPPTIRTLNAPLRLRDALWSSAVPEEAFDDIKRLKYGVSDEVKNGANDPGMISMACIQHAESI